MKKVVLVTEYLNPPYDEGIKKTVYNLYLELNKNYDLKVICRYGFEKENVHILKTNRLFLSQQVKIIIKDFNPDSLIYLPFQSTTFASYLRMRVLSSYLNKADAILIGLQPKPIKKWQKKMVKVIKPKIALTPSPSLKKDWDLLGVNCEITPLLTDLQIFKPIGNNCSKKELREKYGLPMEKYIVSHMGHLNEGRNLKSLIPIQKSGIQVVVVSSSSTPKDAKGHKTIKDELLDSGVIIIDRFIENIEEVYQLSDVYIFPVIKKNSSIGMPLSILEARACGIPVVTTNFGSVRYYLSSDYDGIKYSVQDFFLDSVLEFKKSDKDYIETNVSSLNNKFYDIIYKKIQ